MLKCFRCGTQWTGEKKVSFRAVCENCGSSVHCCRNCKYYDIYAHNKCSMPGTEMVQDREKNNFCDEFVFGETKDDPNSKKNKEDAKKKLEDLFK